MKRKFTMVDMKKTGENIKFYMKKARVSVPGLAKKIDITTNAISNYRNGDNLPGAENMYVLCKEPGVDITDLIVKKWGKIMKKYAQIKKVIEKLCEDKQYQIKRLKNLQYIILDIASPVGSQQIAAGKLSRKSDLISVLVGHMLHACEHMTRKLYGSFYIFPGNGQLQIFSCMSEWSLRST